ncbi:MAG: substrate-binding domain-containing protein [Solirubrobacteraceae bacterium]
MRRGRTALLALACAALAAAAGCGERANNDQAQTEKGSPASRVDPNETYYWISQLSTLPLFVDNDHKGLKRAADELGVKYKIQGPTKIDLTQFIATINQVCAQNPAGVMVVGWDPALNEAVNTCLQQGVPTVTDDADLPGSDRLAFVGTDWYEIGVAQAEAMIEATGATGDVATISIINADNMKAARRGFEDTLQQKAPDMRIVAEEDDGGDRSKAAAKVADLLSAHPDLAGIAGFDAESGPGAVRALTEADKLNKVKLTAMEAEPEFFKSIEDGSVSAIIVQKRELFTYYAMKLLFDYNHSGLSVLGVEKETSAPVPVNVNTGLFVVDKSNVGEVLAATSKK